MTRCLLCRLMCLVIALPTQAGAQSTVISAGYGYGRTLLAEPFLRGENSLARPLARFDNYYAELGWRTDGSRAWHQRYLLPVRGFGVTLLDLHNAEEIGLGVAVYRSFTAPLVLHDHWQIDYGARIGLAGGWHRYDYYDNPFNQLISTRVTAYLRLGLGIRYALSDHVSLRAGLAADHVSNGNLRRPNAGVNAGSGTLGIVYAPGPSRPPLLPPPTTAWRAVSSLSISLYGGAERRLYAINGLPESAYHRGLVHGVGGVSAVLQRRVSAKSSIGLGSALVYRSAGSRHLAVENDRLVDLAPGLYARDLRLAILPTYELIFDRVSVQVQAEYYLLSSRRPGTTLNRFRQKIGLKVHLSDRLFVATLVNARDLSIADFLEWHVGYRFGNRGIWE